MAAVTEFSRFIGFEVGLCMATSTFPRASHLDVTSLAGLKEETTNSKGLGPRTTPQIRNSLWAHLQNSYNYLVDYTIILYCTLHLLKALPH
jgi:hypothetical protein